MIKGSLIESEKFVGISSFKDYILKNEYSDGIQQIDGHPRDNLEIAQGGYRQLGTVPTFGIGLPQVTRRSKVVRVDDRKRLIEIQLADNTKIYMSRAEFERIAGDPVVPNKSILTVVFQRNPNDTSSRDVSNVISARSESVPIIFPSTSPNPNPGIIKQAP